MQQQNGWTGVSVRTKAETERLLGLSEGYLSKSKAATSRRVQAGLRLLAELDATRRHAQEFARYLSLLDQAFPDVTGDSHDELIKGYSERISKLKRSSK